MESILLVPQGSFANTHPMIPKKENHKVDLARRLLSDPNAEPVFSRRLQQLTEQMAADQRAVREELRKLGRPRPH